MKAIKDCEWEVKLEKTISLGTKHKFIYLWKAEVAWDGLSSSPTGILDISSEGWMPLRESKKEWECFAKLNGIKKWKYV